METALFKDCQVVLTLAIFPYSLCPLYFFFAFCDLVMCRGDVLFCKVKYITLPILSTCNFFFMFFKCSPLNSKKTNPQKRVFTYECTIAQQECPTYVIIYRLIILHFPEVHIIDH